MLFIFSDHAGIPLESERKFIVFEGCLRELMGTCRTCCQPCRSEFTVVGTLLRVRMACPQRHVFTWNSQPFVGNNAAGNLLVAAAILFSGCPVAASLRCFRLIEIQTITERTFYNYQRGYLLPAINEVWLHASV